MIEDGSEELQYIDHTNKFFHEELPILPSSSTSPLFSMNFKNSDHNSSFINNLEEQAKGAYDAELQVDKLNLLILSDKNGLIYISAYGTWSIIQFQISNLKQIYHINISLDLQFLIIHYINNKDEHLIINYH